MQISQMLNRCLLEESFTFVQVIYVALHSCLEPLFCYPRSSLQFGIQRLHQGHLDGARLSLSDLCNRPNTTLLFKSEGQVF